MDFAGMIQTWIRVLTGPGEEVFAVEQDRPQATLTTGLIWTVLAAVVTSVLGFVQAMLFRSSTAEAMQIFSGMDLPPESQAMLKSMMSGGFFAGMSGAGALLGIFIAPVVFLIIVGVIHLLSNMLGGQGDFGRFAYLSASIGAPISIVNAFLGFIPVVGGCIGFILTIYSLVLHYFAIKVAYSLTSGRAIAVLAMPVALFVVGSLCIGFAVGAALIGAGA